MKPAYQRLQFLPTVIRIISYLVVLLPAALGFLYVYWFGVNVVNGDSWSMVHDFDKLSSGTLGIADLLALHGDHWIFFPRIVMLTSGTLTQWNSVAEMYLIQFSLLGTLICLMLAFRNSIMSRSAFLPLLMVPISLLVFGFYDSIVLNAFLFTIIFAVTFSVLALYLLYVSKRESPKKAVFVAALGSATVASFSSAHGVFVWPAGLLQLLISPVERPTKRILMVLWGLAGLGVWIAYFIARESKRKEQETGLSALAHPVTGIEYFLKLLGSPLFGETYAFAAGLFLACLVLVSLILIYKDRRRWGEYSFWASLLLWSFLAMFSIVAGRFLAEKGPAFSREVYTTFSLLAIVSIYGLLATAALGKRLSIRRPHMSAILLVLLSGAVLLGAGISYVGKIETGSRIKESREEAAFVLSTYESQPNEVLSEHWGKDPERIRRDAAIVERLGYNVFSVSSKP